MDTGRALRDAGISRAVDHANAVSARWAERAYAVFLRYAGTHEFFTSECLRLECQNQIEAPPNLRAWGGVFMRGRRAGFIVPHGVVTMQSPNVHCSLGRLWRSTVYNAEWPT